MKHALYLQEQGQRPKLFVVLKENSDGTVDIGPAEDKPATVTNCPVAAGKVGCCETGKAAEAAAEAQAETKRAAEKAAAADEKAEAKAALHPTKDAPRHDRK